ncbi:DUF202 domain-containing protein [Agromyces albus]|jgi:hypothetical protein|uniref:DUF202 domain-containing protein n=1 Tax=Agromyces albus TaxID=205332 RepID=UPI002783C701|nr:DUF202 domain-containing protein [Agromyces albus]MDQ0577425.1 tellurite resistance protein TehA-like permease [Agromyces albus]
MDESDGIQASGAKTGVLTIAGVIALAIGIVGVAIYTFTPRNTPVEGDAPADAAWQSGVIIGSALFMGVGALLLLLALVSFLRTRRER